MEPIPAHRNQIQTTRNLHQATMEQSPGNQEANQGNQEISPDHDESKYREPWKQAQRIESESTQPGIFTRQAWNQVNRTRKLIQAIRNILQATMEPSPETQEWIQTTLDLHQSVISPWPGKQEPDTGNLGPWPGNHGTKSG